MTEDEYCGWAAEHMLTFGIEKSESYAAMFNRFFAVVKLADYQLSELCEATTRIAAKEAPRFPGEHLSAINQEIREVRSVNYRQQLAHQDDGRNKDMGTCSACFNSGRVIVPHLKAIKDGEWIPLRMARGAATWYTMAVICSCPIGRWFGDRTDRETKDGKVTLTMDHYQNRNPDWREQMAKRDAELRANSEAKPVTREEEERWKVSLDRLLAAAEEKRRLEVKQGAPHA